MTKPGIFITVEGGEGAGKSTQILLLEAFLKDQGIACLRTREPGGSPGAERIRSLILQGDVARWDPLTEYLLFSAARRDHLIRTVKPALAQGTWVLCDRYIDSSRVYQGGQDGVPSEVIESLYEAVAESLAPDLTLLFDISPEEGLRRADNRGSVENRFENKGLAFHQRVREGFLQLAARDTHRYQVVSADQSVESLQQDIQKIIARRFPQVFPQASPNP